MALIKIKQVDGLQTEVNKIVTETIIDSKDASVLAAASSDAADQITAASIDSKDASVLSAASGDASDQIAAASIDSKDASVLSAASGDASDQIAAASIDSKDASVLAAANGNVTSELANYDLTTVVDSKDASVLAAAEAYADAIEAGLHNYSEERGTFNNPNDFGISGNFDAAGGDYEVYVNGLRIEQAAYTLNPQSNILFNPVLVGYSVEATDSVVIMGHTI